MSQYGTDAASTVGRESAWYEEGRYGRRTTLNGQYGTDNGTEDGMPFSGKYTCLYRHRLVAAIPRVPRLQRSIGVVRERL